MMAGANRPMNKRIPSSRHCFHHPTPIELLLLGHDNRVLVSSSGSLDAFHVGRFDTQLKKIKIKDYH